MNTNTSNKLFAEAKKHIPGGVNSPARAFKSVGRDPLFIAKAKGATLTDVDGNEFVDYIGSWGPMIHGHAFEKILDAVIETAKSSTSFGACCEKEIELAQLIKKFVPSVEIVRMVNSGTEATMSAMRLARGFTGRDKIVKFEGCYHGHGDAFLSKAGSGVATLGLPDSPGVTKATAKDTLNAKFNDIESVYKLVEQNKGEIAAVFIEPVGGNMGCVPSEKEFLQKLRDVCTDEEIVLIFDEVMTGFRLAKGGAQEVYGIAPDLTTFGKIIGGGLPVGAYGGREDIMSNVSPAGAIYQAGTLSGNPLAMAAGIETLKAMEETEDFHKKLDESCEYLYKHIRNLLKEHGFDFTMNIFGSMFTLFFTNEEVKDFDSAKTSDVDLFAKYFNSMLEDGIYLPPSQFEACFVSTTHTQEDFDKTLKGIENFLQNF